MADNTAIRPFHFEAPQAELIDLRNRITATKWPEREQVTDASQGVSRNHTKTHSVFGGLARLAQVRGKDQRPAKLHH